jgi:hypothetical protein
MFVCGSAARAAGSPGVVKLEGIAVTATAAAKAVEARRNLKTRTRADAVFTAGSPLHLAHLLQKSNRRAVTFYDAIKTKLRLTGG